MSTQDLPDITSNINADTPATLSWVGMENIAVPISIRAQDYTSRAFVANANVYVSLDSSDAKGIHMSRLHTIINQLAIMRCDKTNIDKLLQELMASQQGISDSARLTLGFDFLLNKPALLSDKNGFQRYAVKIDAQLTPDGIKTVLDLTIPYSSTCPCSASLAQQLTAQAIDKQFQGKHIDKQQLLEWLESPAGSIATPHSQRSYAHLSLVLGDNEWPEIAQLIFALESVLATPVQTAVKRIDEQEFARLNATNLMFCEDAARKLKSSLNQMADIIDFQGKVEHQESLHAHNAVAIFKK